MSGPDGASSGKKYASRTEAAVIPEPEKSLADARSAIERARLEVGRDPGKREAIVEDGTEDAAIAAMTLAVLTMRFNRATKLQIEKSAGNVPRKLGMRALGWGGQASAVGTSALMAGGAPTAVSAFERVMDVASKIGGIPSDRAQALASIIFTLGLATAAVAGPVLYPFRFRPNNRRDSLEAARVLEKVFGDADGLKRVRRMVADGSINISDIESACEARINELAGPPEPRTQGKIAHASALTAAALAGAVTVAATAESWRGANAQMVDLVKNPGYAFYLKQNPSEEGKKFLELFRQGIILEKGGRAITRTFVGNVGTNVDRVTAGGPKQPFSPDTPPRKK